MFNPACVAIIKLADSSVKAVAAKQQKRKSIKNSSSQGD